MLFQKLHGGDRIVTVSGCQHWPRTSPQLPLSSIFPGLTAAFGLDVWCTLKGGIMVNILLSDIEWSSKICPRLWGISIRSCLQEVHLGGGESCHYLLALLPHLLFQSSKQLVWGQQVHCGYGYSGELALYPLLNSTEVTEKIPIPQSSILHKILLRNDLQGLTSSKTCQLMDGIMYLMLGSLQIPKELLISLLLSHFLLLKQPLSINAEFF